MVDLNPLRLFYVYTLIDPRCGSVFYVGKGKGKRHSAHVAEWRRGVVVNPDKSMRIGEIMRAGLKVEERIVARDLTEEEALDGERHLIAEIGIEKLTNIAPGGGPMTREQYQAHMRAMYDSLKPLRRWLSERPRKARELWMWATFVVHLAREAGIQPIDAEEAVAIGEGDAFFASAAR